VIDRPTGTSDRREGVPGKLVASDLDADAMTPSEALRYSEFAVTSRVDRRAEPGADDGSLAGAFAFIEQSRNGQPLPDALRARLSEELGVDLSSVRIHTDERAAQAAEQLHARAFTIGEDVYFARGAYDPSSGDGIELIAHEVAHVVQQRGGTRASSRARVSQPGDSHERDADAFAARFARGQDPARWINELRRVGDRVPLPMQRELEAHFGTSLDFVETYVGDSARLACQLLAASAFAVRNVVAFADPSPRKDQLMHELAHVIQTGGRAGAAPGAFAIGSLSVSQESAPAEVDARAAARGAPVTATADPGVIHREGTPGNTPPDADTPWSLDDAKDGFTNKFKPKIPMRGADDPYQFAAVGPANDFLLLFDKTSVGMFQLAKYQEAVGHITPEQKKKSAQDLQKLHQQYWKDLGLVQPKIGNPDSTSWAYVDPGEPITQQVLYLLLEERSHPDAKEMWETYCKVVNKLHDKGSIQSFNQVNLGGRQYPVDGKTRSAYTDPEYKALEQQLVDAIVAEPKYRWRAKSYWRTFYKEVCENAPLLPQGAQGKAFKEIIKADTGIFEDEEAVFKDDTLTSQTKTRKADGYTLSGDMILLEAKSGTTPDDKFVSQASDYAKIVRGTGIPAYSPADAKGKTFTRVCYVFATQELAKQYAPKLKTAFAGIEDKLEIVPDPDAIGIATVKANPTFSIPLKQKNVTSHTIVNPPIIQPGMSAKRAVITTDAPNSPNVTGGQLDFDLDMGGAIQGEKVSKTITPDGASGGQIENKMPGLKVPGLDKILPRLTTEAKLTDGGVEASIGITPGPSGVPNLNLTESKLTAKFDGSTLSVDGKIGIAHTSGKVSGSVQVTYAAGQWAFVGTATVTDGIVPGLSGFTAKVKYDAGKWSFGVDQVSYERKIGAVNLKGTAYGVEYDVDKGDFGAMLMLDADLGMFGKASAQGTLEHNKIKKLEVSYDSPELKYPAKSDKPTFTGTIGGTVTYQNDQFSGSIRGTANLAIPALQKIAGEKGVGLAVQAEINADGSYAGSISTTTPLQFGDHFRVPAISCKIDKEGNVSGDFSIEVVKFKYLEQAKIECGIDKDGFHVKKADIKVPFGTEGEKFWGSLAVTYAEGKGLQITGDISYKIKEGMVAHGTLTYSTETNEVKVELSVDEIKLFQYSTSKTLFTFSKQIPLVSIYGLGIYLDLGFDLIFGFDFNLGLAPKITLDGLSLETFTFKSISAEIALLGALIAKLTAQPKVGLGIFALSPSLLRGGGGLKIPITGEAALKPSAKFHVQYAPDGGVTGDASVGMSLQFGIKGAVKPYAELSVLDGAWNPSWEGDNLTEFEIMPPKELFNFTLDFGGDMKKQDPKIPDQPGPPSGATGAKQVEQEKPDTKEAGGGTANKDADPQSSGPSGDGGGLPDEPLKLGSLLSGLKGLPGYQTISAIMQKAGAAWEKIKGFFSRVAKAFTGFFQSMADSMNEIIDGFSTEGLAYLPKLLRKIVGENVWSIIEPLVNVAASTAEALLSAFESDAPKGVGDFFPWALRMASTILGVAWSSLPSVISAVRTMFSRLGAAAQKLVSYMVNQGMIGVQRHTYWYWAFGTHYFLAADRWKANVLGFGLSGEPGATILSAGAAVGFPLYEALEAMGVPPTNTSVDKDANEPYNDRWV
jgi:hypothetical protein